MMRKILLSFVFFLWIAPLAAAEPISLEAMQSEPNIEESVKAPAVVTEMAVIAGLSILPFAIMLLTSYIKIVIVLALLRNALGVQQAPPNQVINGIALLLTVYVMFPTGMAMYERGKDYIENQAPNALFSSEAAYYIANVVEKTKPPLAEFLERNSTPKEISGFYQLAYRAFPPEMRDSLKRNDFLILMPAFILSQLKIAFEIGVLIYLPFFVIDLVTSNILLAMGMFMLSPLTIALPIKLLLLVVIDGWTLLIQGLVLSFR